jgi:hypothetical protein
VPTDQPGGKARLKSVRKIASELTIVRSVRATDRENFHTGLKRETELPKNITAHTDTRPDLEVNALPRLELENNERCDRTVAHTSRGMQKPSGGMQKSSGGMRKQTDTRQLSEISNYTSLIMAVVRLTKRLWV